MRVTKGGVAQSILINVTPLIDVIFVILIFLVSCSEMSRLERFEEVVLPKADQANPEGTEDVDKWVVNMGKEGNALVDGEYVAVNSAKFRDILISQARSKLEKGTDRMTAAQRKGALSDRALVIRADRRMEFKYVQQLILQCQDPKVRLWKVKLQVEVPAKETGPGGPG